MDDDFAAFVARRQGHLLMFAMRLAGSRWAAEDLVQEALLRTGLAWPRVARRDRPEVYVQVVITNLYLNGRRRSVREVLTADPPDDSITELDQTDRFVVREALKVLSKQQRAVIVLRYYVDLSEEQIALELNVARGTVKRTASDALKKLAAVHARSARSGVR